MIKQGLTLYSLTNEWVSGAYELHRLLEKVATLGLVQVSRSSDSRPSMASPM